MSGEYYVRSFEAGLYTVGSDLPDGEWVPESDHPTEAEAKTKAFALNTGLPYPPPANLEPTPAPPAVKPWDLFAAAFIAGNTSGAMSLSGLESLPVRASSFADAMMRERAKRKGVVK